jgi:hypothetical protein
VSEQVIPVRAALKRGRSGYVPSRPRPARVQWVGESDHWVASECQGKPQFIMPLCEDTVLEVATAPSAARKLSLQAAINCTSRLALRVALSATKLNPPWHPLAWHGPSVVKAPASCASLGVRFLPANWYIAALARVAPDLARFGVVEERIEGPQYELDGFVVGGQVGYFSALLQHWNEAGDKILAYERHAPPHEGWLDAALGAVKAVGINDAPFCVELRYDIGRRQWKVIEIHARLGEDPGLPALMSDENPLRVIERACHEHPYWR